ncbi:restriction endonuclease subunit S [Campylobacter sp. Cr9]|uniref:restriction endonuclease subunit S n=1 Tax=Campylobacter sp. Cr9 TaxID=2735728 RepID=UPI003015875D|nr:restriction endonuclease subunit S [Campylobacter sp. Cr9]
MNNWKKCKLGDICSKVTSGGTPLTSNALYYNGIIPWLNTKEVKNCRIYETEKYISQLGLENSSAKWIEANSVIVAMYGATAGKVAINKIPLTTNQACCNLTINHEKADYNFIYYLILNNFETLEILATGAAQQNLNLNTITSLEITLPPLEEQRQIATILSSIDDKIELLHEQNKTLEELAQTLFRHYFIENPNPSWQNVKIKELASITSGKSLKRLDMQDDGENPILGANGIIGFTNKYLYNEPLLYTGRVGTLGKVFMINSAKKVWLSDNTLIIKPSSNFYFMYFVLKTSSLENLDVGSTQPLIRQSDLGEIEILLADDLLLEKFDITAKKIFDKIDKNLEQIQTLENMRDILIPKLLNGEIKINN